MKVERVLAMRAAIGDGKALMMLGIARAFGLPVRVIVSPADLDIRPRRGRRRRKLPY